MSLQPALAKKLFKRGLLTNETYSQLEAKIAKSVNFCPNKSNLYHNCSIWCFKYWKGHQIPELKYAQRVKKLLQKYPLPDNWSEVFDKGIGRYYYWNVLDDKVSWLPPNHPKAEVTECAAKLRMKLNKNSINYLKDNFYKSGKHRVYKKFNERKTI